MNKLIISIALCLILFTPAWGWKEKKPYLAVYCCPGFEIFWPSIKPDNFCLAFDWSQFDDFLRKTKKEANGRPIEIDIDCHGNETGLVISYDDGRTGLPVAKNTSMGFIVNHIETILHGEKVTLLIECCYSGRVYKETIRASKSGESCNHVPQFPIYGGSFNHMNLNNFIYIQYKTKCHRYFEDLRKYETKEGDMKMDENENSIDHNRMAALYKILASLYTPED